MALLLDISSQNSNTAGVPLIINQPPLMLHIKKHYSQPHSLPGESDSRSFLNFMRTCEHANNLFELKSLLHVVWTYWPVYETMKTPALLHFWSYRTVHVLS